MRQMKAALFILAALGFYHGEAHAGYDMDAFDECMLTASEIQALHHAELEEYIDLCIKEK